MGECVCIVQRRVTLKSVADLALLIPVIQAECVHGTDNGGQGLDGVAIDDGLVLLDVIA